MDRLAKNAAESISKETRLEGSKQSEMNNLNYQIHQEKWWQLCEEKVYNYLE